GRRQDYAGARLVEAGRSVRDAEPLRTADHQYTGAREGRAGPAESVRRTVAVGSGSERNPLDNIAVAIRHRHTGAFGIGRREQNHEISVGLRVGLVHHAATAGEAAAVRRLRLLGLLLGAGVLGRTDGALGRLRLSGRPRGAHGAAAGVG